MTPWQQLLEWLHGDHEIRSLTITLRAEPPLDAGEWSYSYELKADDMVTYPTGDDGWQAVTWGAEGTTLDEAAAAVLSAMQRVSP